VAFAKTGDAIGDMAQRTGLAVESISAVEFALGQTDGTLEDLETGIKKMQLAVDGVVDPSEQLAEGLDELGISLEALKGMQPEEQFLRIADAIKAIQDPAKRTAAAVAVFGRSGTKLLPLLLEGKRGIRALMQEAEDLNS